MLGKKEGNTLQDVCWVIWSSPFKPVRRTTVQNQQRWRTSPTGTLGEPSQSTRRRRPTHTHTHTHTHEVLLDQSAVDKSVGGGRN